MLTPEALQSVNDYLTALCDEWQNSVIADIARRLCKSWKLTASAQHQSIQLLRTVKDKGSLIKDIAKMTGALETAVQEVFAYAAEESWIFAQNLANAASVNTVNLAMNELVMQQYVGLLNQTQLEMTNFTRTTGFISSDGQFREIARAYQYELDLATWKISSGTMDATQAIRDAIRSLSKRGITSIDYANGKVSSLDVAVRRSVLTGIGQLTGEISLQTAEKLDTDFVEVSAHYGARPEHAEWQGKVYKLNGSAPGYPNLAEATGYGTGPGLKGWNCRHDFYPFIPGISQRAYTDRELAEMKPEAKQFTFEGKAYDGYTATQMQRRIESAIRKTKRELAGYDAANDTEAFTTQSVKLRQQKELYADFSKAADLPLQNERIQVLGFNKSMSSKAVWAEKKYVQKYAVIRYNKNGTIIVTDDWKSRKHVRLPPVYRPNAVVETISQNGKQIDRMIYDENGRQKTQINSGPHSNPKRHPFGKRGEHAHDIKWENDRIVGRLIRDLNEKERKEHSDIL